MDNAIRRPPCRQARLAILAEIAADRPPSIPVTRNRPAPHAWSWALATVCHGTVPDNLTMEETARFMLETIQEAEDAATHVPGKL